MTDIVAAKEAAKRLFQKYNFQNEPLNSYQVSSLLKETYEYLQIPFNPTNNDIKGFQRVLDADKDGQVTLTDLQTLAIQYLCNDTVGSMLQSPSYSLTQKQAPVYGLKNYKNDYEVPVEKSYESSSSYNYQMKSVGNPSSEFSSYGNQSGYNFTQTYSNSQNYGDSSWNPSSSIQQTQDFSYANKYQNNNTDYNSSSTFNNQDYAYNNTQNYGYNNTQTSNTNQYPSSAYSYEEPQKNEERPYSDLVRQYLSIVGQVFLKYADKVTYSVTEREVPDLLTDTYAVLGREGYEPTGDDVKAWMKLCDVNKDGKVEFQDYEYFVVKSLERSGLDLYD